MNNDMTRDLAAQRANRLTRTAQPPSTWYDYRNQAWVFDGKYAACGHPAGFSIPCFACKHVGETAPIEHYVPSNR